MKKKLSALAATTALIAAAVLMSGAPASAATQFGPYSASGTCNADRTEIILNGGSVGPCFRSTVTGKFYFWKY